MRVALAGAVATAVLFLAACDLAASMVDFRPWQDVAVRAEFELSETRGAAPLEVEFQNRSRNAREFVWHFGDGKISTDANPTHVYTSSGAFTVRLEALGPAGESVKEKPLAVEVAPGPLHAVGVGDRVLRAEAGQQIELRTEARDAYGNLITGVEVVWEVDAPAGSMDATGQLVAGTVAGTYREALSLTASHNGHAASDSLDVVIEPGPVERVEIEPREATLYTADRMSFRLVASDRYGNVIETPSTRWFTTAGGIIGNAAGAEFEAARSPGAVSVEAEVTDGRSSAQGSVAVDVKPGYCDTAAASASWDARWYSIGPDGSPGPERGRARLPGNFGHDWAWSGVFASPGETVGFTAGMEIVVRRHGPVRFMLGGAGTLRLDGADILTASAAAPSSTLVMLTPGVYRLEIEARASSPASLEFRTDADVLNWHEITECFGGYAEPPDRRFAILQSDDPPDDAAGRFAIAGEDIVLSSNQHGAHLLIPGKPASARRTIVIQGLDTRSSCADDPADINRSGLANRTALIVRAIQLDHWRTGNDSSTVDAANLMTFSYSGQYRSCATGEIRMAAELPASGGFHAAYSAADTCAGVKPAAARLEELIDRILEMEPNAEIDLIGHSMGGLVASYMLAGLPPERQDRIRSVVTLDAPLKGVPIAAPLSQCLGTDGAWRDMRMNSDVITRIHSLQDGALAGRIMSINTSPIGSGSQIPGSQWRELQCADAGGLLGGSGSLLDQILGRIINLYTAAHMCVWTDPDALNYLAAFLNR